MVMNKERPIPVESKFGVFFLRVHAHWIVRTRSAKYITIKPMYSIHCETLGWPQLVGLMQVIFN